MPYGFDNDIVPKLGAVQPQKKKKNFWLDQLSTGGGIGGALAGGAAGAAVGSVVPVVGTAVGGILGALLGGAGGSAAGQVGENAITGDKLSNGVAQEALFGGLTSLPVGAGLKLARAGLKASTGFGKVAAADLVQQAGAKTVSRGAIKSGQILGQPLDSNIMGAAAKLGMPTLKGTAKQGAKLEDLGSRMLASQGQVTGAQARQMGIKPVQAFGNINKRTGLTSLDDMAQFSSEMTGGKDSILDTLTRAAVESTNGVDIQDLRPLAQKLIEDKGALLTDGQRKQLLSNVTKAGTTMRGGSAGSLSTLANPSVALDQANSFRSASAAIRNSFNAKPEQKQLAQIYDGLAKQIEESIYKAPGVNDSIGTLAKAGSDDLFIKAQELRQAGNTALADAYQRVGKEVFNMKDVKQLRSLKKDFVDIGKIDNATSQAQGARAFNAEDAISAMRGSPIKGILAAIGNTAVPHLGGAAAAAGRKVAGGAAEVPGRKVGDTLAGLAARQGGARLALGAGQDVDQSAQLPAQPLGADPALTGAQDPSAPQQEPSVGGYTKSQIENAMAQAAAEGNSDAFSQLKDLYSLLPDPEEDTKLNASTAALAAKQDSASSSLDSLLGQYQSAGGGQGKVGGTVANIAGSVGLNANAATYNDSTQAAARQVSRALGEVGAGSNADADAYISMLPRLTDTAEQAQLKVARLKQMLAEARQNTLLYGSGATSDLSSYQ